MTFNIGKQTAGILNNVTGNQRIQGGQHAAAVSREDATFAAATLRELLAATDLTALEIPDQATIVEDAAAIDDEMAASEPSPQKVAVRIERLTSLLSAAGSFVGAGAGLLGPLATIAHWLGPLGASVLRMLPSG